VSLLFSPWTLRSVTFRNRVFLSPMCMYSAIDGIPQPWHLVHLVTRAVGGAGLVMTEATAVSPEGRISPADVGLWNDEQEHAWAPIVRAIREHGAIVGMQLAHAGRKASTAPPWLGGKPVAPADGGWPVIGPSPLPFSDASPTPVELTTQRLDDVVDAFQSAAQRAARIGVQVIELHMAHGYLIHQFLSPLSNQRSDSYGGSPDNRMRLALRVAEAVRAVWPSELPVFARISATDWVDGGWDLASSVELARKLAALGVDAIDTSTGGLVPHAKVPVGPGYQVPFAQAIRQQAGLPTIAVGMITEPAQAEQTVRTGQADAVMLARQLLREPYWPLRAAKQLGASIDWPPQYRRASD